MNSTKTNISSNEITKVFTASDDNIVSIYICNTSDLSCNITIWISSSTTTPVDGERIEYKMILYPSGILERGGIPIIKNENIYVQCDKGQIDVRVCGIY